VSLLAQHPLVAVRHVNGGWSSTKEDSGVAVAEVVICFACKGRGMLGSNSGVVHEEGCPCVVGAAKRQKQQCPLTDETPAGSACCPTCAVPSPLTQGSGTRSVLCVCGKYWETPAASTTVGTTTAPPAAPASTSTSISPLHEAAVAPVGYYGHGKLAVLCC
jgi:hypothetical protein